MICAGSIALKCSSTAESRFLRRCVTYTGANANFQEAGDGHTRIQVGCLLNRVKLRQEEGV